jgi:hypothetical protein
VNALASFTADEGYFSGQDDSNMRGRIRSHGCFDVDAK